MLLYNQTQVDLVIAKAMANALDYAMDELYDELMYNLDLMYDANEPDPNSEDSYKRTFDFMNSWRTTKSEIIGNIVKSELYQDYAFMSANADNFQHASSYQSYDVRPNLADIIENGLSGNLFGEGYWTDKRPFFQPTLDCINNGTFITWVIDGLTKQGIVSYLK